MQEYNEQEFEYDYFINSSISNYQDYLQKKYNMLAEEIIWELKIKEKDNVLDFGCATGALLKEFKKRGYKNIIGTDISVWAIEYGKNHFGMKNNLKHYSLDLLTTENDWIFFLDVLEHMNDPELNRIFKILSKHKPNKGVVVRIPVSLDEGENYAYEISRNDKTHIQCHSKKWWLKFFKKYKFKFSKVFLSQNIYDSKGVLAWVIK